MLAMAISLYLKSSRGKGEQEGSRNEGYSGIQQSSQGPSCENKEGEQDRIEKKMKRKRKTDSQEGRWFRGQ